MAAGRDIVNSPVYCGSTDAILKDITEQLRKVSIEKGEMEQKAKILDPYDEKFHSLLEKVNVALNAGDHDQAAEFLRQVRELHSDAAAQLKRIADQHMLDAAQAASTQGSLAMLDRKFSDAAMFFDQAASYTPPDYKEERTGYLVKEANAYFTLGEEPGDRTGFERAIALSKRVILDWSDKNHENYIAQLKNNMGIALMKLGERDGDDDNIKRAIEAFEDSLKLRRKDVSARDWAEENENLAHAYWTVGEREKNISYLNKAVTAFKNALTEREPQVTPRDWATTESNLGSVLRAIGDLTKNPEILNQSIEKLNAALKVRQSWRDQESSPGQYTIAWGTTQSQLALAKLSLGQITKNSHIIEESVEAFKLTLTAWPRERMPQYWASTQLNIGNAYSSLGEMTNDVTFLRKAVEAQRAALEERRHGEYPFQWAIIQTDLGVSLSQLGLREAGTDDLESARHAFDAALTVFTADKYLLNYQLVIRNKDRVLREISHRRRNAR